MVALSLIRYDVQLPRHGLCDSVLYSSRGRYVHVDDEREQLQAEGMNEADVGTVSNC